MTTLANPAIETERRKRRLRTVSYLIIEKKAVVRALQDMQQQATNSLTRLMEEEETLKSILHLDNTDSQISDAEKSELLRDLDTAFEVARMNDDCDLGQKPIDGGDSQIGGTAADVAIHEFAPAGDLAQESAPHNMPRSTYMTGARDFEDGGHFDADLHGHS